MPHPSAGTNLAPPLCPHHLVHPCFPAGARCPRRQAPPAPGATPPNPAFLSKLVVTLFSSPPKSAPGRALMFHRCPPPHGLSLLAARISRISHRSPFMPDPKDQPAGRRRPAHLALSARSPSNPASSSCTHVVRARQFHPHQQTTNKHRPFSRPATTPRHFLIACPMSHGCVCCFPSGWPPPCLVPPPLPSSFRFLRTNCLKSGLVCPGAARRQHRQFFAQQPNSRRMRSPLSQA
jgi:hypothetical protein